ncbi:MAG: mechanosensitive ion channel family protein [Clostridia bacterium]|nr:mechanosensitive ion channel family protein [Clostridia bacterium]
MPNMVFDTVPSSDEALQEFVDSVESLGLKQWLIGIGLFLLLLIVTHFLMRLFTKRLDKSERISKSLHTVLVTVVRFALILASILIASNAVGISLSGVLVLFGVLGAAVTLAAQGILSNIAGCIILLSGRMFEVDDYIETPSGSVTVKEINLLNTKLLSYEGATIYIPNSVLYTEPVTNQSAYKKRRANITFRISNAYGPDAVREAAMEATTKIPYILDDPAPLLVVSGYSAGHVNYTLLSWATADNYWPMRNGLTEQLYASFKEHGIAMTNENFSIVVQDA